jgi:hypothetical protein
VLTESDGHGLFLGRQHRGANYLRPHRGVMHEGTLVPFSDHLLVQPYCAASSLSGAADRCIAARMACVVVALP